MARQPMSTAARLVRSFGEAGDPLALKIFEQQAIAIGRLLTIAANFTDPHVYLLCGGVFEAKPEFRHWFLRRGRPHPAVRPDSALADSLTLVPRAGMHDAARASH